MYSGSSCPCHSSAHHVCALITGIALISCSCCETAAGARAVTRRSQVTGVADLFVGSRLQYLNEFLICHVTSPKRKDSAVCLINSKFGVNDCGVMLMVLMMANPKGAKAL